MSSGVECAQVRLLGSVERLLMVVQHESVQTYETAFMTVECMMVEYRRAVSAEMNTLDLLNQINGRVG